MEKDQYICSMRGCRRKQTVDHTDIKHFALRCRCGARMMFNKTVYEVSGSVSTVQTSRPVEVI